MPIQDLVRKWNQNPGADSGDGEPLEGIVLEEADAAALADSIGAHTHDMAPDPAPARRSSKPPKRESRDVPKANAQTRREVRDSITMMITMPAGIWAFRDPHCGGALLEHADNIAAKLTPIVCRNPAMLAWFTTSSAYMDWFALFTAMAPVARAVWDHHVVGPREEVSHAGADDSAPAQSAPDFSQFAAPAFSG